MATQEESNNNLIISIILAAIIVIIVFINSFSNGYEILDYIFYITIGAVLLRWILKPNK